MSTGLPDPEILRPLDETPLDGWKEIAEVTRLSVRQAMRQAARPRDPLPVYRYGKSRVFAWPSEVRTWCRRQVLPYQVAAIVDAYDDESESLMSHRVTRD